MEKLKITKIAKMSGPFDYNGVVVSKSQPNKVLRTVKKTVLLDSIDRDASKYYTNGDFVMFLPRVYENVVSMRLVAAEFPPLVTSGGAPGALSHSYRNGQNITSATWASDTPIATSSNTYYFLLDIEGLNKTDETTVSGQRSTFTDSFYAKIPAITTTYGTQSFIEYNDHSNQENIARFSPPVSKIDRVHICTRLHSQQDKSGFIYWTTNGAVASGTNQRGAGFNLTLEIEMLANVFDDFSSFETHLRS